MAEVHSEQERYEASNVPHDRPPLMPEELALRALIDRLFDTTKEADDE